DAEEQVRGEGGGDCPFCAQRGPPGSEDEERGRDVQHHERGEGQIILARDIRPEAPEERVVKAGHEEEEGAPDADALFHLAPAKDENGGGDEERRGNGEDGRVKTDGVPAFEAGHDVVLDEAVAGLLERILVAEVGVEGGGEKGGAEQKKEGAGPVCERTEA